MTPEEILEIIATQNIRLTPRFDYVRGLLRPVGWSAGRMKARGCTIFVPPDQFAVGATPIEAVENLLAGKTEFVWVGGPKTGGYIPAGDVAAWEAAEEWP